MDNPYTSEDEELRKFVNERIEYWTAKEKEEIEWTNWQKRFNQNVENLKGIDEDPDISVDSKKQKWQELLDAYSKENPYSGEDERLRLYVKERINHWRKLLESPEHITDEKREYLNLLDNLDDNVKKILYKSYNAYKKINSLMAKIEYKSVHSYIVPYEEEFIYLYPDKIYYQHKSRGEISLTNIVNGDRGVSISSPKKKKFLSMEDIKNIRFFNLCYILNSLHKYNCKYLKTEMINGIFFDIVHISDNDEKWVKLFINQNTGLIEIHERTLGRKKRKKVQRIIYSDFKEIKGIEIPIAHKIEIYEEGKKTSEEKTREIKINVPVDSKIFKLE